MGKSKKLKNVIKILCVNFSKKRKEYYAFFAKSFEEKIKEFDKRNVYCFDLHDLKRGFYS